MNQQMVLAMASLVTNIYAFKLANYDFHKRNPFIYRINSAREPSGREVVSVMISVDVAVIGGGPGGMAAALTAKKSGAERVLILERDYDLGGILPQCIHDGFGTFVMKERLTGPEYADRYKLMALESGIECLLNTTVLEISEDRTILAVNPVQRMLQIQAGAVILAMGCRERTRSQVLIPGTRPAGVFTAGAAQRLVNIEGFLPGRRAVILGSGDIGLIMARRLTLEGVDVEGVYEILLHPSGLTRNVVQCLNDYQIPLHLSHTITRIHGKKRVEGVTVSQVDPNRQPIPGSERFVPCDVVILSVGLIPENELSEKTGVRLDQITGGPLVDENMETSRPGIFACGNVLNVYDLVDYVTYTGETAGRGAARFIRGQLPARHPISMVAGSGVRLVVPQQITPERVAETLNLYLRVEEVSTNVRILVMNSEQILASRKERVVKPPEMVTIKISSEKFRQLPEGTQITVKMVKAGEAAS
jgi:NADPH-dependent 2,4-dienoyl-CoA reductase/sulfur reductase-like enzyme